MKKQVFLALGLLVSFFSIHASEIMFNCYSGAISPEENSVAYSSLSSNFKPIPLPVQFTPAPNTYYRPWNIELWAYEGRTAKIYYTIDGSTPSDSSTLYTSPIYIDKDTEIRAISYRNGEAGEVRVVQYYIKELPETLEANTEYLIDFPDLDKTANDTDAFARINIPENFDPEKEHPLFVWFNGGNGSNATKAPRGIIENKDFVVVGLPYLNWDAPEGGGWQTPWSYHKRMLDSIGELIPNIDAKRRIVGGFSSGGAMIAMHINRSNLAFQDYFSAYLPSGATGASSVPDDALEAIKDSPMLITIGEEDPRYPYVEFYYDLVKDDADAEFNSLEGVGHNLPLSSYPYIKDWIYRKVMQGSELLSINEIDKNGVQIKIKDRLLEINNLNDDNGVSVHISNLLGQIIQVEDVDLGNTSIHLKQTIKPNAFYILSVLKQGKFIFNKKFVLLN